MLHRTPRLLMLILLVVVFALLACDLGSVTASKPTTMIVSPPSGSQFRDGEEVAIQSTSTDSAGVVRVELLVDGNVVRTDPVPAPQISYPLIQTWKATQGTHTISVRAYNTSNMVSDPAAIAITVLTASGTSPSTGPTSISLQPTAALPATPVATTAPVPGACTNAFQFIADVTVPDGTVLAAGQSFNKIWRVKNTGTCNWDNTYQFVYVGSEAMSSVAAITVPFTASGATADLLVPMTAPAAPGIHTSQWRLKSASAGIFGPTLTVNINVPGAPPPVSSPTPTATTPPPGCSGTPSIASFTASATTITAGQNTTLQWGLVSNANAVEIDHDIGGVATPGNTTVSPTATTTYTLTARCGTTTATRQVTITVNPAGPVVLYDFVASAPGAVWYSGANQVSSGYLTWGDSANLNGTNSEGFMRWVDMTLLEDNNTVTRALETHPKWVDNGFITAQYTISGTIQAGTHFKTKYGFIKGATGKVEFVAGVIVGSTPTRIVDASKQANGSLVNVDVDLSPYAGQTIKFYLEAIAQNPAAGQDWAVWVNPRLEK